MPYKRVQIVSILRLVNNIESLKLIIAPIFEYLASKAVLTFFRPVGQDFLDIFCSYWFYAIKRSQTTAYDVEKLCIKSTS